MRAGLADGAIDAIATDHAPHTPETKDQPFDQAPPGMLGLETAARSGHHGARAASVAGFSPCSVWQPAAIAGLTESHGGPIGPGAPANLCVIDPIETWTVDATALRQP